jgi:hypothetical protein
VIRFDDVADRFDETRGGESRGDDIAAELYAWLPVPASPVLEVGVGTGVVALGLRRRGCSVVGVVRLAERHWQSSPERELDLIRQRVWTALLGLDDVTFERLTRPTVEALAALPPGPATRSVEVDLVVLRLSEPARQHGSRFSSLRRRSPRAR